jgi:hypothetical protein
VDTSVQAASSASATAAAATGLLRPPNGASAVTIRSAAAVHTTTAAMPVEPAKNPPPVNAKYSVSAAGRTIRIAAAPLAAEKGRNSGRSRRFGLVNLAGHDWLLGQAA